MQKKMIGILAGVASIHAVVITGLLASGGCTKTEILAPHTYVDGPDLSQTAAVSGETAADNSAAPVVPGSEPEVRPVENKEPVVVPPAADPEPVAAPPVAKGGTYTVKAGDTLSAIAYRHGVSTRDLAAYNNLSGKAVNNLKIGQKLNIPAAGSYTAPKSTAAKSTKKAADKKAETKTVRQERPADGIVVVKKGDTLDRIARRYGTTGKAIAAENNIDINKTLQIGDKLRLPAAGAAAVSTAAAAASVPATAVAPAAPAAKLGSEVGDDLMPELNAPASTDVTAPVTVPDPAAEVSMPASSQSAAAPTPATAPAASATPTVNTDALEVTRDMTVAEFCKSANVDEATLRRLNPSIPADGKLKANTYLMVPQL